jgi:hypothetical protein
MSEEILMGKTDWQKCVCIREHIQGEHANPKEYVY